MSLQNRSLGLGFGKNNHFYVRLGEPNKLMINELPLPPEVITELQKSLQVEIKKATDNKGKKSSASIDGTIFSTVLTNILKKHYKEEDISNMVSNTLALIMPDVLVDVNITRLNEHILPKAMKDSELKELLAFGLNKFFMFSAAGDLDFCTGIGKNNAPLYRPDTYFNYDDMQNEEHDSVREEAQISQRFLKSLIVSKYIKDFGIPANIKEEKEIDEWKNKILKEQLAVIFYDLTGKMPHGININDIKPKINLQDNDVYAYLVPAIMDRMGDDHLKKASSRIANYLSVTDFKPLSSDKYAELQLKLASKGVNLVNTNQRSLQFFPHARTEQDDSGLDFRGKKYQFQHTHIHFEKDGEEKEFVVKDKDGTVLKFDGEVHSVFEYIPAEKEGKTDRQKRLIAVHYPLKVDKEKNSDNPDIQELLDSIDANEKNWIEEVRKWENRANKNDHKPKPLLIPVELDFGKVFLNSLNEQSAKGQLLHHSWASLRSGTHGFKSGLRFIISTQPIHISETQYNKLKKIFGKMRTDLKEEEILDPIDRKAGWRKARTTLVKELTQLAKQAPAFRAH